MEDSKNGVGVTLSNVIHSFPNSGVILDGLSFNINPGDFISILGPSGCGKSTLLRLLADLDKPAEGSIQFDDTKTRPLECGFVFQEPRLLPWQSVLENVKLPLVLKGDSQDFSEKKAREIIKQVNLINSIHKFPNELSGGMKMRVSLARAIVSRPSLLLLDEPFSALDEPTRMSFQTDLRSLWQNYRMTVIFVTHSISEAVYLSNRIIVLSHSPAKILSDQAIALPDTRPSHIRMGDLFTEEIKKVRNSLPVRLEI